MTTIDKSQARALASILTAEELDEYVREGFEEGFDAQNHFAATFLAGFGFRITDQNVDTMEAAIDNAAPEMGIF